MPMNTTSNTTKDLPTKPVIGTRKHSVLTERLVSAAVGSTVTVIATNPIEVIKSRLQVQKLGQTSGSIELLNSIIRVEGPAALWRGLPPALIAAVPTTMLYFGTFEAIRSRTNEMYGPGVLATGTAGTIARSFVAIVVSPIELVRTYMQSTSAVDAKAQGISAIMKEVVQKRGITGLWAGVGPTLFRDAPFSAIYWSLLEYIRITLNAYIPGTDRMKLFAVDFTAGAVSGMIAASVTTPFDVLKTRAQLSAVDSSSIRSTSMTKAWNSIIQTEGTKGLFRGVIPRVVKIAPACAITISSYEITKRFLQGA